MYDLRRTPGSWQALTGTSLQVIDKSLGHKSSQATREMAGHSTEQPESQVNAEEDGD